MKEVAYGDGVARIRTKQKRKVWDVIFSILRCESLKQCMIKWHLGVTMQIATS